MGSTAKTSPLSASDLQVAWTTTPKPVPVSPAEGSKPPESTTDHMVLAQWTAEDGWGKPKIVPYGPLPLDPMSSVLHYATECFEGLKVYRGHDGQLRLFRPEYNCRRMNQSAARVSLPQFDERGLLDIIHKLCAVDGPKWLPKDRAGTALYVRPALIGIDTTIGPVVSRRALLCIFLVYWPGPSSLAATGRRGSRLLASQASAARAFPGGTGAAKIGANYGPSLVEYARAQAAGYDQVLWLYGQDRQITEAGGANIFIIWTTPQGERQMVTPPLNEDKLILAGNTRRSTIELARELFSGQDKDASIRCDVIERKVVMEEIESAVNQGRLESLFVTGTAWGISSVEVIGFDSKDIQIPVDKVPHVFLLRERMDGIMYGSVESNWTQLVLEAP